MTVLVAGATASIGKEIVTVLLARGARVRALVRTHERAQLLPSGVEPAVVTAGPKLADFRRSYGFIARFRLPTSARDVAATTALLGRPPRRYETYVRDTAERWSRENRHNGPRDLASPCIPPEVP
jgi:NAD(P)-dependent dehydrogenase (short-subunit alcohol dehydrogenase family)